MRNLVTAFICLLLTIPCTADIITVDDDGPADFDNIQAAIDAAVDGDEVVVADGVYTGEGNRDIDFKGKAITVRSENGPENCIIDCQNLSSGFYFHNNENADSIIDGLTIVNGYTGLTHGGGAGIYCGISSPMIRNCIISDNSTSYSGSGMAIYGSSPTLINCIFSGNSASNEGGGIYNNDGSPTLINCIFSNNSADSGGGFFNFGEARPILRNCLFVGNSATYGGGIATYRYNQTLNMINCTFSGNFADQGGAIHCGSYGNSSSVITNCIFLANEATDGPQMYLEYSSCNASVSYSNIKGGQDGIYAAPGSTINWGPGNIDADPYFVDPTAGDYHLLAGSPCINTGDPNLDLQSNPIDIDHQPRIMQGCVDMGIDEYGTESLPLIATNLSQIDFTVAVNEPNPAPKSLAIWNMGLDTLNWQIIEDCPWLDVSPVSGNSAGEIDQVTLTVDPYGLAIGDHSCGIIIQGLNAANGPLTVTVVLHILSELVRVPEDVPTIQDAIDHVLEEGTVIVTDGIYTGPGNRDIDFKGKAIIVRSEDGPNNCIIDCNSTEAESHYGFFFRNGEDANSILNGFTITNGEYGIFCDGSRDHYINDTNPSIINCNINYNERDGILCYDSNPTIIDCIISNNGDCGIDIDNFYQESIRNGKCTITNCKIINNFRGVDCMTRGSLTISKCLISGNSTGGGINCEGFGWYPYDEHAQFIITDCIITNNSSFSGGGISFELQSAIYSTVKVNNCEISGNSAGRRGGAINYIGYYYTDSVSNLTISDCTITNNSVYSDTLPGAVGGAIYCDNWSKLIIINSTITGNSANASGQAYGGAIYCGDWSNPIISNCTITGNSAYSVNSSMVSGGGIYCGYQSKPEISNSIFWGNLPEQIGDPYDTTTATYSDVQGGWGGQGNIDADPCFVELGYWADVNDPNIIVEPNDPNAVWIEGDYHLLEGSPCINTGDPNYPVDANDSDIDGLPRIIAGRIDMGAYEFDSRPIADAGPNQVAYAWIDGLAEVTLDGNDSYDPDGNELTYLWSWTVDSNTYEANGVSPTIELPVGEHIIELVVNDGIDDSEPNESVVTVTGPMYSHLWLSPQVIHRHSFGPKRIMALVSLPKGITKNHIDESELLRLYYGDIGIEAVKQHIFNIGSRRRRTQHAIIFAAFDKAELLAAISDSGRLELQAVGMLKTGRYFYGFDTIRIKRHPRWPWRRRRR